MARAHRRLSANRPMSQKTGFERVAPQGRLPAWISSPIADIASRRRSSSTRSGLSPVHIEATGTWRSYWPNEAWRFPMKRCGGGFLKFGPGFARRLRRSRPRPSNRWHLDEMVVRIAGKRMYLWRAVDHEGEVLDIWFSAAVTSARHSGSCASCSGNRAFVPKLLTTDKLGSYGSAFSAPAPALSHLTNSSRLFPPCSRVGAGQQARLAFPDLQAAHSRPLHLITTALRDNTRGRTTPT